MRKLMYVNGFLLLLAVGCGSDDEKNSTSVESQATTCANACVKISACVGQPQAQCEEKCGFFSQPQLQCVAGTTTCPAAEACLDPSSNNSNNTPSNNTPSNNTPSNNTPSNNTPSGDCSGPLGACEVDEICVRKNAVYNCVKTNLQSCNEDAFPDICDCLYPSFGVVPPEAEALCSSEGISGCSITNNRLSVDCQ